MRLSNKSRAPYFNFIHTLLLLFLFAGLVFFVFERFSYKRFGFEENLFIIVPIILLLIFYMRGKQIFDVLGQSCGDTAPLAETLPNLHGISGSLFLF